VEGIGQLLSERGEQGNNSLLAQNRVKKRCCPTARYYKTVTWNGTQAHHRRTPNHLPVRSQKGKRKIRALLVEHYYEQHRGTIEKCNGHGEDERKVSLQKRERSTIGALHRQRCEERHQTTGRQRVPKEDVQGWKRIPLTRGEETSWICTLPALLETRECAYFGPKAAGQSTREKEVWYEKPFGPQTEN